MLTITLAGRSRTLIATAVALAVTASASAKLSFRVTDLGPLPDADSSYAYGINLKGVVVGESGQRAVLWSPPDYSILNLGTLPGGRYSAGRAVNNLSRVAGYSEDLGLGRIADPNAFVWDSGNGMLNIGTLGGRSWAYGLNTALPQLSYQVVGASEVDNLGARHAFRWSPDTGMVDIGTLGGPSSSAYGVNDQGLAVGVADTGDGDPHATLWSGPMDVVQDLGTLGGRTSAARAINGLPLVVGESQTVAGQTHAFLWDSRVDRLTAMTDLGTLGGANSSASALNADGEVVGRSDTWDGYVHAAIWLWGNIIDLNVLIPEDSGWTLIDATGINDRRQICGVGLLKGKKHAFLLTPVQ